jgi:glycerol-3-phosphate dehydrogenase
MAGCRSVRLRPSKGVHLTLERRISNVAVIARAVDGRALFVQPHENTTIIGTTDDDYYGDPAAIPIQNDEVEYLLQAAERVLPSIRDYRLLRAWAGVRPTLFEDARTEDDLSRRHEVFDHARRDGVPGLVTLAGGKLATYRLMAEETADLVLALLGKGGVDRAARGLPEAGGRGFAPGAFGSRTHLEPLPGGDATPSVAEVSGRFGIDRMCAQRLIFRHGSRVERIFAECGGEPSARRVICTSEPVTEAEIRWCCRTEWVTSLEDLRRRTRFAEGPCQGLECVREGARILAEELGWDAARTEEETLRFLEARFRERVPALRGRQLAQEELLLGALLGVEGIGRALLPEEAR